MDYCGARSQIYMLSELENATVDFPIRQIHGRIHDPRHCGWGQLVAFVCLCFFRGRSGTQQRQKGKYHYQRHHFHAPAHIFVNLT